MLAIQGGGYVNIKVPEKFLEKMNVGSESEVEIEFIGDHVELRPVKVKAEEDRTKELISILKNPPEGLTDLKEYNYEDID